MTTHTVRTLSERRIDELNLDALRAGELTAEDFRISGEVLRQQADAAERAGYRQLAENLRRAAELTRVSNEEVFEIYSALRPGRTTYRQLVEMADHLENELDAPRTAALVREATEVYRERGILKSEG